MSTLIPQQLVAAQQSSLEALFCLTNKAFEGFEQLVALNLQVGKAVLAENQEIVAKALSAGNPGALVSAIQQQVRTIDANVPLFEIRTIGEHLQIATMLQAPVVAFRNGRGIVSDRHFLSQSFVAGYELWKNTDVVLGVGTRMEQHTTLDRVQNLETHQTLLERVLRIGTVNFDTAATDDSDFKFEGVASPRHVVAAVDEAQQEAAAAAAAAVGPVLPADAQ